MRYNSSISQSFMVMSFVAAGLLLSVQLVGNSPSPDRSSPDRDSQAQLQNRPSIQSSKIQSAVPNTMAIATPSHRQAQDQAVTGTVPRQTPSLLWQWPFRIRRSPIQKAKKEGTQAISLHPVSNNSVNQSRGNPTVLPFPLQDDKSSNHQQTEHTLTEPSEADGKRRPSALANKPQASSLPIAPHSTQIDPTQQDLTNQAITTHNPTAQTRRQQERTMARLVVDLSDRQLLFHQQGEDVKTYPIAVGKAGWETPLGEFTVTDKDPSPLWQHPLTGELVPAGSDSPLGSRWIGFWTDGIHQIGFHGTNQSQSIGQAISHGCIRLHDGDIQELYAQVALGTPVIVQP